MFSGKNRLAILGFSILSFVTFNSVGEAATTQKCFQHIVGGPVYRSVAVPNRTYRIKISDFSIIGYIKAQGTADYSTRITQVNQAIANIPNLQLSNTAASRVLRFYRDQIADIRAREKDAAIAACIAAIKPQRLTAMVPPPRDFEYLGPMYLGEDPDGPYSHYGDCNGVRGSRNVCRKASDLR